MRNPVSSTITLFLREMVMGTDVRCRCHLRGKLRRRRGWGSGAVSDDFDDVIVVVR